MSKRSQRESYSTDQNNNDSLEPSSSKRVRFHTTNDPATESGANEEGEYEFDHEDSLEKAKPRRGAVKLQGYASDETDTSDDDGTALFNRRKGGSKNTTEYDDMFADDDDVSSNLKEPKDIDGKKKVRYLEMDEIEGQEYTSKDAYDEESGETIIEAFNMKAELEEGRFDEAGNYVRNKKDPNAFHDNWLQGLSRKDIEKAKRAHEKQEQERKLKEAEEASNPLDRVSIWKELLTIMKRGETLLDALQRLGGGLGGNKGKNKRGQKQYKKRKGKPDETIEMVDEEELTPLTPEEIAEQERKKQIERLTDLSDKMMALGHFNVYDDTWEQILRNLKREGAVPDDWTPINVEAEKDEDKLLTNNVTTNPENINTNYNTQQLYWEYKWTDASGANSNEIHGPFSGEDMKAWNDQGFFAQGILVRKANTEDEFVSSNGIDFTGFT